MSENNQTNQNDEPKKKMSLQEAMKQQLENKKNKAAAGTNSGNGLQNNKKREVQAMETK